MTLETQTEAALSGYVKEFLLEFKDEKGNCRYVDESENMMPSKSFGIRPVSKLSFFNASTAHQWAVASVTLS